MEFLPFQSDCNGLNQFQPPVTERLAISGYLPYTGIVRFHYPVTRSVRLPEIFRTRVVPGIVIVLERHYVESIGQKDGAGSILYLADDYRVGIIGPEQVFAVHPDLEMAASRAYLEPHP